MSEKKILDKIERKSAERTRARNGGDPVRAAEADKALEELYSELRTERARSKNGDRNGIVRRARIERELEKLMSD